MTTRKLLIRRLKFNPVGGSVAIKRDSKKLGYKISKQEIKNIWEASVEIVKEELLEKGEVDLKFGIGKLNVYRIDIANLKKIVFKKVGLNQPRLGKHYFIGLEPGKKMFPKMKIRPSKELKKSLTEKLKTKIEYKPATLKYHGY